MPSPPWTQWAAAEIFAHQLLEQEVANLRGYCRSNSWRRSESDWMDSLSKTHCWRELSCATHHQPGRRNVSETWGCSGLPKCHLCLGGCWKSPQSSCWSLQLAGCPASPRAGPGITEPRLPQTWAGGIPSCLNAPPAPASTDSLIFAVIITGHSLWRTQQFWLQNRLTQLAFRKVSHGSSLCLCTVNLFLWGKFFFKSFCKIQGQNENPEE